MKKVIVLWVFVAIIGGLVFSNLVVGKDESPGITPAQIMLISETNKLGQSPVAGVPSNLPTYEDCNALKKSDGDSDPCYLALAISTKNESICEKVEGSFGMIRKSCYQNVFDNKNVTTESSCIKATSGVKECYGVLASVTHNRVFCNKSSFPFFCKIDVTIKGLLDKIGLGFL